MASFPLVRSGRRLAALLTLACAALAQAAMLDCPMAAAAPPVAGVAGQHAAHAGHAHGGAESDSPVGSAVGAATASQSESGCTMAVGCGAAGITAPRWPGATMSAAGADAVRPFLALDYRTVFPPHDPPPPRLGV